MKKLASILRANGLFIASNNRGKLLEFDRILAPPGIEVSSPATFGLQLDVEETADTFRGNATLKARQFYEALEKKMPVLADDSGLSVDALEGAPGVLSARYGGEGLDDGGRRRLLLENLAKLRLKPEERSAHFTCVLALVLSERPEDIYYFEGRVEGRILESERGEGGFGYDAIFYEPRNDASFGELDSARKDLISHRGQAMRLFMEAVREQ